MGHGELTEKVKWELRELGKPGRGFGDPRKGGLWGDPRWAGRRVLGVLTVEERRGLGKAGMEVQGLPGPKKRGDLESGRSEMPGKEAVV